MAFYRGGLMSGGLLSWWPYDMEPVFILILKVRPVPLAVALVQLRKMVEASRPCREFHERQLSDAVN